MWRRQSKYRESRAAFGRMWKLRLTDCADIMSAI